MKMTTTRLIDLPPELIEQILLFSDPIEVSSVSRTSRFFNKIIYGAPDHYHLWRALYLTFDLDDPRVCVTLLGGRPNPDSIDWKARVQRVVRARTVIERMRISNPAKERIVETAETMLDLASNVRPAQNPFETAELSENLLWVAAMLQGGTILDDETWASTSYEKQLRARLHTYFGLTPQDGTASRLLASRALVYDMRNYKPENHFGPFMMRGSPAYDDDDDEGGTKVNWVHVKALQHVMSMHLVDLGEDGQDALFTVFPMSLPFTQAVIPRGVDVSEEWDWAGVEGLWTCSFCFCDHRDLLTYNNFSIPQNQPLDASIFEDPDFREEFRSLDVKMTVTGSESSRFYRFPTIRFEGEMGSYSRMTGTIQMTDDEQIRWQFLSGDQGQAIWSSEGIQIGGIRSPYGVVGSWTTMFHDSDDPVGPFWLRKTFTGSETL